MAREAQSSVGCHIGDRLALQYLEIMIVMKVALF